LLKVLAWSIQLRVEVMVPMLSTLVVKKRAPPAIFQLFYPIFSKTIVVAAVQGTIGVWKIYQMTGNK
jgi:hypothetical protein